MDPDWAPHGSATDLGLQRLRMFQLYLRLYLRPFLCIHVCIMYSVYPAYAPHGVASDLGLHRLRMFHVSMFIS